MQFANPSAHGKIIGNARGIDVLGKRRSGVINGRDIGPAPTFFVTASATVAVDSNVTFKWGPIDSSHPAFNHVDIPDDWKQTHDGSQYRVEPVDGTYLCLMSAYIETPDAPTPPFTVSAEVSGSNAIPTGARMWVAADPRDRLVLPQLATLDRYGSLASYRVEGLYADPDPGSYTDPARIPVPPFVIPAGDPAGSPPFPFGANLDRCTSLVQIGAQDGLVVQAFGGHDFVGFTPGPVLVTLAMALITIQDSFYFTPPDPT